MFSGKSDGAGRAVQSKKIVVIGGGYVGLVSAVCLASVGHSVRLVEQDKNKAKTIKSGRVPFFEPGLDDVLKSLDGHDGFKVFDSLDSAMAFGPDVVLLCVGTPSASGGQADLSQVWAAVDQFCSSVRQECVFACKSTVPVGVSSQIELRIASSLVEEEKDFKVGVAFVPEFLSQGCAIRDFLFTDRVVIGASCPKVAEKVRSFHQPIIDAGAQVFLMSTQSAELVKYTANAMLATRISLINQVAELCEKVGGDIEQVSTAVGADSRIGPEFLAAGLGFGGSCLPKDLLALQKMGAEFGLSMSVVKGALEANQAAREGFLEKILEVYPSLVGKKIGLYGLAFKPGTDDLRYSPGLWLAEKLAERGGTVVVYDEHCQGFSAALAGARKEWKGSLEVAKDLAQLLAQDFLVITQKTEELKSLTPEQFLALTDQAVFDGRNCFDQLLMATTGVSYHSVGRGLEAQKSSAKKLKPKSKQNA